MVAISRRVCRILLYLACRTPCVDVCFIVFVVCCLELFQPLSSMTLILSSVVVEVILCCREKSLDLGRRCRQQIVFCRNIDAYCRTHSRMNGCRQRFDNFSRPFSGDHPRHF